MNDQHPIRNYAWDAIAAGLIVVSVILGLCLFVEYGQLTAVSRLALGGIIAASVGVVVGKRIVGRRRVRD